MNYHMPSYYKAFTCTAGDCPNTCCSSWEVVVDAHTRAKYETLNGPLGERVRRCLRQDADGDSYLAFEHGHCPMLAESGLCSLQKTYGSEMLSSVCNRYPRYIYEFGALTEVGVSLSCPAACDLILNTPFSICETVNSDPPSLNDIDPMAFYTAKNGREIAFRIASDSRFPVFSRMALILKLGEALEDAIEDPADVLADWNHAARWPEILDSIHSKDSGDFSILLTVFQNMEPLTDRYPALLNTLSDTAPLPDSTLAERLLQYYLYKYMLQAAYDGTLLSNLQFAAASLLMIGAMFSSAQPDTPEACTDLLHRFARETEHSDANLQQFADWAGKHRQHLLVSLLLRP